MRPPSASLARTAFPAAHFDRNERHVISRTGDQKYFEKPESIAIFWRSWTENQSIC